MPPTMSCSESGKEGEFTLNAAALKANGNLIGKEREKKNNE